MEFLNEFLLQNCFNYKTALVQHDNFEQINAYIATLAFQSFYVGALNGFQVCQTLCDPFAKGTNISV